jgi:hypothetical protein
MITLPAISLLSVVLVLVWRLVTICVVVRYQGI